ncbi:hypothetical protein [Vibrio sp. 10N]|uniref:hypothetical protein n=1 Tax=Vibrio sp. 10N TaxID=3058938 RepID=UPI0028136EA3|nr:hypothetical protein VB10N_46300 [Vibrio sp. 10N]
MYQVKLEVHGCEIKRYVAKVKSEQTGLFFSVEVTHAHADTAYHSIFDQDVKFAVETCIVKNPDTWTYHDLIKRQYVMSQHMWIYLAKLLVNLNVVEKGQQVEFCYERNGLPFTTYVRAGELDAA